MPAQLPPELIDAPTRYLREVEVGQQCATNYTAMKVDKRGFCYLDPTAQMRLATEPIMMDIGVQRDASGYHVTIERDHGPRLTFMRKPFVPFRRWIPVESFNEIQRKIRVIS